MGDVSLRVATKRRLLELLKAQLVTDGMGGQDGVACTYSWPGGDLRDEHMWLGGSTGVVEVNDMRAGRKARNDVFQITVHFLAARGGQENAEDAEARAEQIYGACANVLADNPQLRSDVTDPTTALPGIQWAAQQQALTEFDEPELGEEGFVCEGRTTVIVRSILN